MWIAALALTALVTPGQVAEPPAPNQASALNVFLDCAETDCFEDYLRDETPFVNYVRDRGDADVHILITSVETGARGEEYTLSFIGQGTYAATARVLTVVSQPGDSEDRARRRLATAMSVGLLDYLAGGRVPDALAVSVDVTDTGTAPRPAATDRWRQWIYSLNGSAELEAEESTRERQWSLSVGADRITERWKMTFGSEFSQTREEFDLDEEMPLAIERRERELRWLVAKSIGEHWAAGTTGEVRSSTFDNTALAIDAAPAVEWNFFPYSMYTRRQLRVTYSIGVQRARYDEETLFGKLEETRGRQELATTYEQREPWGTLEGRVEWSNYFPGLDLHRLNVDTEVSLRISRGLSLSIEASASRIRDQLSLPRRAATPEEVLLQIRELRSGFEARVSFGITYQFGSAFASIVNPRFGQ